MSLSVWRRHHVERRVLFGCEPCWLRIVNIETNRWERHCCSMGRVTFAWKGYREPVGDGDASIREGLCLEFSRGWALEGHIV